MAHRTLRSGYDRLVDRLNRFPQGAPPSALLYRILQVLVSDREAGLVIGEYTLECRNESAHGVITGLAA